MLSNEMQYWIKQNSDAKHAARTLDFTPELALSARKTIDQMLSRLPVPEEITVHEERINGIKGEFYHYTGQRNESLNNKIVLFIHGGAFSAGTVTSRRYMCTTALKHAKIDGFSIEYTQYPEGMFPEGLVDCIRAFKGLVKQGYSPENIYLLGESAGAVLSLSMTLYLKEHWKSLPGKVCIFSPPVNIEAEFPGYKSRIEKAERDPVIQNTASAFHQLGVYFSKEDRKSKYASTIYGNYTGFPRLLINVGTEEVLFDDSVALAEKAKSAGVDVTLKIWDGLFHVFPMFPAPESDIALKYVGQFLAE